MTTIGILKRRGIVQLFSEDPETVRIANLALSSEHDVVATSVLGEAVDMARLGVDPDVIVADASGVKLYAYLQRLAPHLVERILFLVDDAVDPMTCAFLESIPNARLSKSASAARLREVVRSRLRLRDR